MDRRQIIRNYFRDHHLDKEQIRCLYIEPIVEMFGLLSDYTEMIQMFGSIDEIPTAFIEDLGNSLGYEFLQDEDPEIQREIIKRILSFYKNRATEESITKVLKHSTDRNWQGDNLTLYKGKVKSGYSEIFIPMDRIFTHDKSFHDSGDRFMDRFNYNYGIIDLYAQYFDDRTLEMLERQIPGGIRWNINQLIWMETCGTGFVDYSVEYNEEDYVEDLTLKNDKIYVPSDYAFFDEREKKLRSSVGVILDAGVLGFPISDTGLHAGELGEGIPELALHAGSFSTYRKRIRSGRFVVQTDVIEEIMFGSSYLGTTVLDSTGLGRHRNVAVVAGLLGSRSRGKILGISNIPRLGVGINTLVRSFRVESEYKGIRLRDGALHDDGKSMDGAQEWNVVLYAKYDESMPMAVTDSAESIVDSPLLGTNTDVKIGFEIIEEG
jgi:hypothetical protein